MSEFKDYFSNQAKEYHTYRPQYPLSLAKYLLKISPGSHLAWEAGCGSGQFSTLLGDNFDRVIATDPSREQLSHAKSHPHVEYHCAIAHVSNLPDNAVDLAVAAQAAHWFDLPLYYQEVKRVLRKEGIIALISYGIMIVNEDIDAMISHFYKNELGAYWPSERKQVEEGYRHLLFPFQEIKTPDFCMIHEWAFPQLIGYIHTWSATSAMEKAKGNKPFADFCEELLKIWGPMEKKYKITWPLALKVGRI